MTKQYYVLDSEPPPAEALEVERRRLENGVGDDERILGSGALSYYVICDGDAAEVLARAKEIMRIVNARGVDDRWPEDDRWLELLPKRFVDACAPERTPTEIARQQAELTYEQKLENARTKKWSLSGFLFWMDPCVRLDPDGSQMWIWFDDELLDDDTFLVHIDDMGDAQGASPPGLRWLFRACGAQDMEVADFEHMIRSLR